MIRSLRKGSVSLELNHKYGTDSINAIETEIELNDGKAIFRTKLKPVDSNQSDDANRFVNINNYGLETISLIDSQIRNRLIKFIKVYSEEIEEIIVEILYKRTFSFSAEIVPIENDGVLFNL